MSDQIEILWGNKAKMKAGQGMKEHRHSCFQLYYILSGTPEYLVGGTSIKTRAGSYFVVPPMTPHSMLPLEGDELACYELKFLIKEPELARKFQTVRPAMNDTGVVLKLLKYAIRNWNSTAKQTGSNLEYILVTILMGFYVDELTYTERESRFVTTGGYNKITKDILIYVERHFVHEFTLDQLAAALSYNKNYLATTFKKNTGYTIIDYVNMLRIHDAVIMFVYYDQDVSSTCECVGFHDVSYFSRIFKAMTGVSPRTFKTALARSDPKSGEKHHLLEPIIDFRLYNMEAAFQALRNIEMFCE